MIKKTNSQLDKNIIVTGAAGLVGYAVVKHLASLGCSITVVVRRETDELQKVASEVVVCDLSKKPLKEMLTLQSYDHVVHCAAVIPGNDITAEKAGSINKIIDKNIGDFCLETATSLIYISSTSVYGLISELVDEDSRVNPQDTYAKNKYSSEEMYITSQIPCTIFRISAPYGIRQKTPTVLQIFIQRCMKSLPIMYHGAGKRAQDFIHPKDIACAVERAIIVDSRGIFNLASGTTISMNELGVLVSTIVSRKEIDVFSSGQVDPQESFRAKYNIDKIRRILSWTPKFSLIDGIIEYADNLKKN